MGLYVQNRYENNKNIVKILDHLVEMHPELRFNQLLQVYAFITEFDEFYMESEELLNRVEEKLSLGVYGKSDSN